MGWAMGYTGLQIAAAAGAAVVALLFSIAPRQLPPAEPSPVARLKWKATSSQSSFAEHAAAGGLPLILTNTPCEQWPAMSWDGLDGLVKAAGGPDTLLPGQVYVHRQNNTDGVDSGNPSWRFGPYFDPSRPMARLSSVAAAKPNTYMDNVTMTLGELSAAMQAGQDSRADGAARAVYLSTELHRFNNDVLVSTGQLEPGLTELMRLNPGRTSLNIWIGHRGVTTPCHYDGYHNVFVQIQGVKKLTLWPPETNLSVFPFLHPSHAQCLMDRGGSEAIEGSGRQTVTISPGEVLYLPPLWRHEVEVMSKEVSISVNGWTEPEEELGAVAALFAVQAPVPRKGQQQYRAGELKAEKSTAYKSRTAFWSLMWLLWSHPLLHSNTAKVLRQRYAPLLRRGELQATPELRRQAAGWGTKGCHAIPDANSGSKRLGSCMGCLLWNESLPSVALRATLAQPAELQAFRSEWDSHAGRLNARTRDVWVGNWVEATVASIVGVQAASGFFEDFEHCAAVFLDGLMREL